ncbi:MAG: rRNA maturation RNase YbeY [Gammaproteobacteria bacterium]|nr:rRNA maturation RNase YbeY [Gammaproteobacteria bacterium]
MNLNLTIDTQYGEGISEDNPNLPTLNDLDKWIRKALLEEAIYLSLLEQKDKDTVEVGIRYTDTQEIQELNAEYRQIDKATNILSFASEVPDFVEDNNIIGDLVVCPEIIEKEAREESIPLVAHWAHIIIHGILHLLEYDHEDDDEAEIMEALEVKILESLDFADPY